MEELKNVAPLQDFDWDAFENGNANAGMTQGKGKKKMKMPGFDSLFK